MAIRNWVGYLKALTCGHQLVLRSMSTLVQQYPNAAFDPDFLTGSREKISSVSASQGAMTHASSAKVKFLGVFIGLVDDSKRKRQYEKALEKRRRVIHRLRQLQKQRKEAWEKEVERLAFNAFTRGYRKTLTTLRSGKAKQAISDKATELGMKAALTLIDQYPLMTSDDLKKLLEQEEDHFGRLGWDYLPVSVKTAYENLMLSIDDACEELKAQAESSRSRQALPVGNQQMETISADAEQHDFLHPTDSGNPEVSGPDLNLCYENVLERLGDPENLHAAYERIKPKLQLLSGKSDEDWDDPSLSSFDHMAQSLQSGTYQFSPVSQIRVRKPGKEGAVRAIVVVNPRDQIVAEAVRAELERIYEPVFMVNAYRYKLARSCHMALKMIKNSWKGTTWFIHYKSPIAFGKAQHENLLRIMTLRIKDEEFLYVIQQMFKTGVISLGDHGSRLSALFCNIYYHQLDAEVTRMQAKLNTGSNMRHQPQVSPYARVRYVRYGEEFLFGITGSKAMAIDVLDRVQVFLRRELKLHGP